MRWPQHLDRLYIDYTWWVLAYLDPYGYGLVMLCNEELEVLNGGTKGFAFCGNNSTKH